MVSKWELVINIVARAFKYIINSNIAMIDPPILADLNLLTLLILMIFFTLKTEPGMIDIIISIPVKLLVQAFFKSSTVLPTVSNNLNSHAHILGITINETMQVVGY